MCFLSGYAHIGNVKLRQPLYMAEETDRYGVRLKRLIQIMAIIIGVYILLSFLGLGTWFGIDNLGFSRSYIFRHSYFLFAFPIGLTMAEAAYSGHIQKILTNRLHCFVVLRFFI